MFIVLEGWVPWDDVIEVSAGKLRKVWDSLRELRSSQTTGKESSDACAIACQNCAVYSVFPPGMTPHGKIAQFNWECITPLNCINVLHNIPPKITSLKMATLDGRNM